MKRLSKKGLKKLLHDTPGLSRREKEQASDILKGHLGDGKLSKGEIDRLTRHMRLGDNDLLGKNDAKHIRDTLEDFLEDPE